MLRSIDRFVDLGELRAYLAPFYGSTGRPSVDPELLIRMLIVGYCYGIRSKRLQPPAGPHAPEDCRHREGGRRGRNHTGH
jgi:hypothetical protein